MFLVGRFRAQSKDGPFGVCRIDIVARMSDAGKPVSASEVTFIRTMSQLDANMLGNVHGGVIMREVDSAAGTAAIRHAGRPAVTAAIDELAFLDQVHVGDILFVRASVNDVGRTSMEIGVRVEAEPLRGGPRRHTTSAYLVFVALDDHGVPTPVPPLIVETPEERRRQTQARIRRQVRQERRERLRSVDR
jgi:acyl-CoA hydrolase